MKTPQRIKDSKVVAIGNITTGGTGKTPATIYFAGILKEEYNDIAILSRGYKGSLVKEGAIISDGSRLFHSAEESGDEPWLLAANLPGIPVAVGRNRYKNGLRLQKEFGNRFFLLDDGFQHYALERDVDIVLIDATNPFGNGHTLPNGILREPPEALRRADIVILTKCSLVNGQDLDMLSRQITQLSGHDLVFRSDHVPVGLVKLPVDYSLQTVKTTRVHKPAILKNESVWALSAIANHRAFEKTLMSMGATEVKGISFRDHHKFSKKDVENILKRVSTYDYLITTEKDWVRLQPYTDMFAHLKNFYYVKIEFQILSQEVLLREGLKAKIIAGKTT